MSVEPALPDVPAVADGVQGTGGGEGQPGLFGYLAVGHAFGRRSEGRSNLLDLLG